MFEMQLLFKGFLSHIFLKGGDIMKKSFILLVCSLLCASPVLSFAVMSLADLQLEKYNTTKYMGGHFPRTTPNKWETKEANANLVASILDGKLVICQQSQESTSFDTTTLGATINPMMYFTSACIDTADCYDSVMALGEAEREASIERLKMRFATNSFLSKMENPSFHYQYGMDSYANDFSADGIIRKTAASIDEIFIAPVPTTQGRQKLYGKTTWHPLPPPRPPFLNEGECITFNKLKSANRLSQFN